MDTICAMAGALAGALWGAAAFSDLGLCDLEDPAVGVHAMRAAREGQRSPTAAAFPTRGGTRCEAPVPPWCAMRPCGMLSKMPVTPAAVHGPWLEPFGSGFRLSDSACEALSVVLGCLRLEPTRPRIGFGFTAQATAFVVGRHITIDRRRWQALTTVRQLSLLAHELTHVAQYDALGSLGVVRFLIRYLPSYWLDPANYRLPAELAACPLHEVDPLDPRYTLDQLAARFAYGCADA